MNTADLIARYDGRVPRYTSYPTAPHFHADLGTATYEQWLSSIPAAVDLSLYLHVPFCDRLCLYCGCNTSVVRRDGPRRAYAARLIAELEMVAARIGRRARVAHIHWGGGTPTTLPADCLLEIMGTIRRLFSVNADAEIAIEIDPTAVPADRLEALPGMGITRASLGVQDFDPAVQTAIARIQTFEATEHCARALRALQIPSLNLDLIYGLPHQTADSVTRTARQALALGADRVAVFGYAHVPWMKRHQKLIDEDALPNPVQRFDQRAAIDQVLVDEGGYLAVGLDHYARPGDAMARAADSQALHRSFQGYTTDPSPVLIGIGASAIGSLPQGYVQNITAVPAYLAAIDQGQLAIARGIALTEDDRVRRDVIEHIMCDLEVDLDAIAKAHGVDSAPLLAAACAIDRFQTDGLVQREGGRIVVQAAGRPFLRSVAAVFDAYLNQANGPARHAQAV